MDSNGADSRSGPPPADAVPQPGTRWQSAVPDAAQVPATARNADPATRTVPVRPRRGRSRARTRGLARLSLVVLLIFGTLFGIAGFRLSQGPVSLAFLKSAVEQSFVAELPGHKIRIGDAQLGLGADGFEVALSDIQISEPGGAPLVQAPRAVIGLSGKALLSARIAPSRIDLIKPRLQFFYTEDGTLSVKFARPNEPGDGERAQPAAAETGAAPALPAEGSGQIELIKTITDISAQARRREHVTAFLHEVGLRDATLIVDNGRRKTIWRVPQARIDLSHKASRSLVAGRATIDSLTGPWTLDFQAAEAAEAQEIIVQAKVQGVNPRGLSRLVPVMTAFEHFDVPHDGETRLVLSSKGAVRTATFALTARPGQIVPASNRQRPAAVEAGTLKGDYERARNRFAITEASLSVDRNHIDLQGEAVRAAELTNEGLALWHFAFVSTGGALAPAAPGGDPVKIDRFNVRGQLIPEAGRVVLQEMNFNAGGAAITAIGRISDLATDANRAAGLEARIAPMPLKRLLALWPSTIAPEARTWLATRLTKGQLTSGAFKLASTGDQPIALALEIGGAEIIAAPGLPPLEIPRALVRLEGGGLEVTIPDASIGAEGRRLAFKALRFTAVDTANGDTPFGEAAFRVVGPLATALDLTDREPLRLLKSRGVVLQSPEGRLDGQFKITLPLADTLQASELRTEGRVRLTDVRVRQALGPHDLTGGKADIEISETAIDARGDFLVKGIPFKFSGQHFLNTTPDRQSPFRLTAKLDDADRTGLGLDINDLVSGEVPLEITLQPDAQGAYQARVTADLSKAELAIDSVAYRKPPGVTARVQFDPVKAAQGRTELREFKIIGDTIAAEGIITLGPDNKAKELSFPDFSLNVVTRLNVQGKLRPDHIWDVTAKGSTFDGRELFRDLFNVQSHPRPVPKDKPGLDLLAEIDTVLGFSDTNLKSVHLTLQRRNDNGHERTVSLDVSAKHDSGKPFEAHIRSTAAGERNLNAASQDAGQIFKTVGFYPNAMGGRMALEVALDGRGVVERNGVLKAEGFAIFGDPVVSEVFQNGEGGSTAVNRGPRRKVTREQFDFDWMVLPFSVGGCQFVMNDVQIKGPLVGATMRGKADFRSQRIQIGGTYVPLSGLNSAIGGLPIFGQILAGPKGEGIFGITFAIQGPMASPEVLVNPFSGFVPGILRETQQLTPDRFKITPCADPPTPAARRDGARASSAPPPPAGRAPSAVAPRAQPPDVLTDWTSDTKTDAKARTKPQPQAGN